MGQPAASEADTVPGTVADTAPATASKVEAAPAFWAVDLAGEWADRDRSWGTAMVQVATARPTAGGGSRGVMRHATRAGPTTPQRSPADTPASRAAHWLRHPPRPVVAPALRAAR